MDKPNNLYKNKLFLHFKHNELNLRSLKNSTILNLISFALTNEIENKKWFVLMTQPRAAVKVGKRLSEINIENFVPLQRQLRQWNDRKKWIEVPIFNYYIFAHLNPRKKNEVFNVMGITKFLTLDGKICIISNTEIERIHRLCSYSGTISLQKGTLKEGDEVDIMEGHFIGLRGKVIRTSTNQKVTISIPSLNCLATIIIDKKNIQKTFA